MLSDKVLRGTMISLYARGSKRKLLYCESGIRDSRVRCPIGGEASPVKEEEE